MLIFSPGTSQCMLRDTNKFYYLHPDSILTCEGIFTPLFFIQPPPFLSVLSFIYLSPSHSFNESLFLSVSPSFLLSLSLFLSLFLSHYLSFFVHQRKKREKERRYFSYFLILQEMLEKEK